MYRGGFIAPSVEVVLGVLLRFSKNGFLPIIALAPEYVQNRKLCAEYTAIKPYTHMVILTPHPRAAMQATLERDPSATATPTTRDAGRVDIDQRIDQMEIHYTYHDPQKALARIACTR